jgi:hypothetical protein
VLVISNLIPSFILTLSLQVNYSFYMWKTKNEVDKPWKFSTVRVLVVDEGSLVSVGIFKSVLQLLCKHSKLSKLIILGELDGRESAHSVNRAAGAAVDVSLAFALLAVGSFSHSP